MKLLTKLSLAFLAAFWLTLVAGQRAGAQSVYVPTPTDPAFAAALSAKAAGSVTASRREAFQGIPIGWTGTVVPFSTMTLGGTVNSATSRVPFVVIQDCYNVRFHYCNQSGLSEAGGANAITLAHVALETQAGAIYPVTFAGGQTSITLQPKQEIDTDPVPVFIAANTRAIARTYFTTPANGGATPIAYTCATDTAYDGYEEGTGDKSQTGSLADPYKFVYGPNFVLATPVQPGQPVVLSVGDSITAGQADNGGIGGTGYAMRALTGAGICYLNCGIPGDLAANFLVPSNSISRRTAICKYASYVTVMYGTNDLAGGATSTQIIAELTSLCGLYKRMGIPVYICTILPRSTSTDNWMTTTNQTTTAYNSVRVAINTAIRTNPSALNATGYFETADSVESARNSGLWRNAVPVIPPISGTISSFVSLGNYYVQISDTSRSFTPSTMPSSVTFTSGANNGRTINGPVYINSTTFQISQTYDPTPGDTYTMPAVAAVPYTGDGIHPSPTGYATVAGAINTAKFTTP